MNDDTSDVFKFRISPKLRNQLLKSMVAIMDRNSPGYSPDPAHQIKACMAVLQMDRLNVEREKLDLLKEKLKLDCPPPPVIQQETPEQCHARLNALAINLGLGPLEGLEETTG